MLSLCLVIQRGRVIQPECLAKTLFLQKKFTKNLILNGIQWLFNRSFKESQILSK